MILIIRLSSMQKGVYRLSSKVTHPVSISKSLRVSNSSSTESNTKKKSKTKRTKPKLGFFSSAFADIRGRIATFQADWDEMNKNLAPIPSESPPESGWRKIWTDYQSMDKATQKKFVEECKALNWDFIFNEDKANETIDNDLRLIEAINDEIRRREEMKANNSSEGLVEVDDATENKVNLAEILANLKIVASPTFIADAKRISGVEDALKFANDHKAEGVQAIETIATDRMEAMGEVIDEFMLGYRESKESSYMEASTDDDYVSKTFMPLYDNLKEKAIIIKDELQKGSKELDENEKLIEFEKLTNEEKIIRLKTENDLMLSKFPGQDILLSGAVDDDNNNEKIAIQKMKLESDMMYARMTGQDISQLNLNDENDRIAIAKIREESDEVFARLSGQSVAELSQSDEDDKIAIAKIYAENREMYKEEYAQSDRELEMLKSVFKEKIKEDDRKKDVDNDNDNDSEEEDDDEEEEERKENERMAETERLNEIRDMRRMKIDSALWYKKYFGGNIPIEIKELMKEEEEAEAQTSRQIEGNEKGEQQNIKLIDSPGKEIVEIVENKKNNRTLEEEIEKSELEQIEIDCAIEYQKYMGGEFPDKVKELIEKKNKEKNIDEDDMDEKNKKK